MSTRLRLRRGTQAEGSWMSDPQVNVVIDSREPDMVGVLVDGHEMVEDSMTTELAAADLSVSGVGIERKTPSDWMSSMTEDRLPEQVRKLDDAYDRARILIEGSFADFESARGPDAKSARGMAASVTERWGIPVIPVGGEPGRDAMLNLVDYAVRLGAKATTEPSSDYLPSSDVGQDYPLGARLWGCLDGIGATRAKSLHDSLGSPLTHSPDVDELTDVEGIGTKTAESVVKRFEGE